MLETKNFKILLPGKKEINIPDLSLEKNKILAFCGQSGSGKTMTAKALIGMLPPSVSLCSNSQLTFNSTVLTGLNSDDFRKFRWVNLGWIDQDPNMFFNPVMTIGEHVLEKVQDLSFWQTLLESLQLPKSINDCYPHQLSGGMKQRAMLAYALVHKPRLIIADEPSTALDRDTKGEILKLLKKVQALTNSLLIFITHEIDLAWSIADSILFFSQSDAKFIETKEISVKHSPLNSFFEHYVYFCTGSTHLPSDKPEKIFNITASSHNLENFTVDINQDIGANKKIYFESEKCTLSVKNSIFSNELELLSDVSCQIALGEIAMIIGRSGSGKSTFMNIFKGLYQLRGSYCFPSGRGKIGMIFQNPAASLNAHLTVEENLVDALDWTHCNSEDKRSRLIYVLEKVGFTEEILTRYPSQFSGGQMQRIALARTLLFEPNVLLLDEPTSSLDIQTQNEVIDLIQSLHSELSLTILWVTHDKCLANRFADTLIEIKDKKLYQYNRHCITLS